MSDSPKRTSDGFEVHMGINFLGHYALTRRLLKLMRSTAKIAADGVRFGLRKQIKFGFADYNSICLTELWRLPAVCT